MEEQLSLEFLRVVEQAAIESAKTMGRGDGHMADQAAVGAINMGGDLVGLPIDRRIAHRTRTLGRTRILGEIEIRVHRTNAANRARAICP